MVLSLFRDSLKEGALKYTDWCQEVEEYLRKGYDENRVKDAMLYSVEGQAYVNFRSCDEGRNHTPAQILREMDSIYNMSVTFWDLNAQMCRLKQVLLQADGGHQCQTGAVPWRSFWPGS